MLQSMLDRSLHAGFAFEWAMQKMKIGLLTEVFVYTNQQNGRFRNVCSSREALLGTMRTPVL